MSPLPIRNLPAASSEDLNKWVVVELSTTGERETNIKSIVNSVHKILRRNDIEVFIPAISQNVRDESQTLFYLSGYIFIKYLDNIPYYKLKETNYFQDVLCSKIGRKAVYSLLSNKDLEPIKQGMNKLKFNEFNIDDLVRIKIGQYKNLRGTISLVYEDGENVQVVISLRSKKILIDFPSTYLEKIKEL